MAFIDCGTNCWWKFSTKDCGEKKKCICDICTPLQSLGPNGIIQYDVCRQECMNSDATKRPTSLEAFKTALSANTSQKQAEIDKTTKSYQNIIFIILAAILGMIGALIWLWKSKK